MGGILASPQTAKKPLTKQRLAEARPPVDTFFQKVPEAKAYLFNVHSLNALYDTGRVVPTWTSVIPKNPIEFERLEREDRYPAAAWRLQSAPAASGIAAFILSEMPNGHERVSCLLALPGFFYWVPDSTILYLHAPALGSYPRFPIAPLFPDEPSGHDILGAHAAFEESFPDVAAAVLAAWGSSAAPH